MKDSLLNAQTHPRGLQIDTPKGRQLGTNQGGEKTEMLRQATDAALQLGAHGEAQQGEGQNHVAVSTLFS